MVFKKSFTLLVASGTTPFFAVVSVISENHCRYKREFIEKFLEEFLKKVIEFLIQFNVNFP